MKKRQKEILQQRLKETRKRTGTERRERLKKKRQKGGEHQITKPNRNRWRSFTTNVLIVI